jgi:hypothetical protein
MTVHRRWNGAEGSDAGQPAIAPGGSVGDPAVIESRPVRVLP